MDQDPFLVLGLSPNADDEAVKQRYLVLVRQFSPERDPVRFQAIRRAYEALRDARGRLRARLFGTSRSGVALLKRSLFADITEEPGRAPYNAIQAVLQETLMTVSQTMLTELLEREDESARPHG